MSTLQNIKTYSIELRKLRSPLASTMQFHLAEITKIGKEKGHETTEDEVLQYVKKTVAKLHEDVHASKDEIEALERFMPKMASREEVEEFLSSIDTSNKGAVMKAVKERFGVNVDLKMVSGMI